MHRVGSTPTHTQTLSHTYVCTVEGKSDAVRMVGVNRGGEGSERCWLPGQVGRGREEIRWGRSRESSKCNADNHEHEALVEVVAGDCELANQRSSTFLGSVHRWRHRFPIIYYCNFPSRGEQLSPLL